MSFRSHQFRKPTIYVAEAEYDRLSNLAEVTPTRGGALLGDELVRAIVLKPGDHPREFVRLHSIVDFSDLATGRTRRVQIVPPDEADIDKGRLSVVTPVGAALLGLTRGGSIGITTEDGRAQILQVNRLENVREAA